MKILVTGAWGFIGKNIVTHLIGEHNVLYPPHREVDWTSEKTTTYLIDHNPDVIIHCATKDTPNCLKENLQMFMNLASFNKKMIYFGSGAELLTDDYGFSKYIMSQFAQCVRYIYNLRLFTVFGQHEDYMKRFISSAIKHKIEGKPIIIYNDVALDFFYVKDLCKIVEWFVNNKPIYNTYNICSGQPMKLSYIAEMVGVEYLVEEQSDKVYTAVPTFRNDLKPELTPLPEAIRELENYYRDRGFDPSDTGRHNEPPRV